MNDHEFEYCICADFSAGGVDLLQRLEADSKLSSNKRAAEGLKEMHLLFTLLDAYGVLDKVILTISTFIIGTNDSYLLQISFDLSLARGLDYYTGVVYEAVVEASAPPGFGIDAVQDEPTADKKTKRSRKKGDDDEVDESSVGVGSIAAGGRYDNLVSMFLNAAAGEGKKKAQNVPCIGVSFGMDRIFAILWPKWGSRGMRSKETMAYVMSARDGLLEERIKLVKELRSAGIKVSSVRRCTPHEHDAISVDRLPGQIQAQI